MPAPAIAIRHLTRAFRTLQVLQDINLEVPRGAVVCILGANGSGKTTLLEILATLLRPTGGQAFVHGLDVATEGAAIRRIAGYGLSNLQTFYPQLSGRRNLEFFAAIHRLDPGRACHRTAALLDALGLASAADARVQEFSDGMKARLSVARALIADPPVLLLDEPTKSLDEAARSSVRELVASPTDRGEPRTVVWTTHDRREAVAMADVVRELNAGVLREVSSRPRSSPVGQAVPA
jgi:ABC-2 type transport system ATP-binding protein